jgi:protein-S-isoprenylcysteine O-methyltransferase Ste14
MEDDMKSIRNASKPWIVRWRSWTSMLVISPFAIAAALSAPMVPANSAVDRLCGMAGWTCFCAGAMFRWWATLYIGGRKLQLLAVDGPYSICRNPLYLGSFLLALSIAFFANSVTFAVGLLIATPIYLSKTVPWEEARLQEAFGDEFDEYLSRVPKFIPRLRLFHSPPTVPVSLRGMTAECRNSICWLWIPFLAETLTRLRLESWWPSILYLP